jgi:hypothetical protein
MSAARSPALPCGGAVEVARSYLKVHVKDRWTGACRGCRDHYPCPERRDAEALLGVPPKGAPLAWILRVLGCPNSPKLSRSARTHPYEARPHEARSWPSTTGRVRDVPDRRRVARPAPVTPA